MLWNDIYFLYLGIVLILYAILAKTQGKIISLKSLKIAKKKGEYESDEEFTFSFALYIGFGVFLIVLYFFARIGLLY